MLATQTPETGPEAKEVKQWIKEKIALTLKALQKRYVTTDAVVTSEDSEANLLCCALEAVFIHGIKSKYVRSEVGGRGRKGGSLPQPVFWSLLKTVTHRDVILELEQLNFVSSDVGRCRAWVRLALNDGLVECYLTSLLREGATLSGHYQAGALLLDPEEREVLLGLLQGLSSLSFCLSYKSAVLNEWTATPLALAGLCPAVPEDRATIPPPSLSDGKRRKESWDTVSQSSGGSDAGGRGGGGGGGGGSGGSRTPLTSSNLSLDTTGSSQLSSSLSSDSLLHGHGNSQRSPEGQSWSCDVDLTEGKKTLREESPPSSQGGGDSFSSGAAADHLSETGAFSGSDSDTHLVPEPRTHSPARDTHVHTDSPARDTHPRTDSPARDTHARTDSPARDTHARTDSPARDTHAPPPGREMAADTAREEARDPASETAIETTRLKLSGAALTETPFRETSQPSPVPSDLGDPTATPVMTSDLKVTCAPPAVHPAVRRSESTLSRRTSADSFHNPTSWISEEDFYTPPLEESSDPEGPPSFSTAHMNGTVSPTPETEPPPSPPSVVHRRQIGLSNPFRGLLKLGQLERRSAVGMWREHYCELSPFELRLYQNAEERACCDNCSLLRCEGAHLYSAGEGRFSLVFPGKRLCLRAASRGEAEDWVDRVLEAVDKCRSALRDEQWEVLRAPCGGDPDATPSPLSAPSSPEHGTDPAEPPPPPPPQQLLDWTRRAEPEPDAVKEATLYQAGPPDEHSAEGWTPLLLSLSLEELRGFRVAGDGRKAPLFCHPIQAVRDVVPDASLGGPAFFKVLTARDALTLRAESGEEARAWRGLIRGALESYLDSEEDGGGAGEVVGGRGGQVGGNVRRLVQHRLKGDSVLLQHLCTVPTERGLDLQNFKCAGCPKPIGVSLGKARLCEFSGQYYCDTCHHGDTIVIPSRMVHNWDLTPREVSQQALKLLAQIEHEPLLNLDLLNPDLCDHTDTMVTVRNLRQRLRLLGDYLLICRSGVRKKIQARLEQRSYLLECSHMFSAKDLRQVAEGHYESYLQSLIQFSSNHVHHCDLCTQRGFICQICNSDDIIFPFQFETTTRCRECKSVFHSSCKAQSPGCPRCARLQRYLERDLQD